MQLKDMHTFFVVTRAGTMQKAARELGVTPGAVSQRVQSIENNLGRRLFSRSRKGVALTKSGELLWKDVEAAFSALEAAEIKHFRNSRDQHIRISTTPTFAYSCLVPRLGEFSDRYPNIKISIETDKKMVDLRSEPVDLAIRHGNGNYAGCKSEWITSPELIVVGSPSLLKTGGPIRKASDCLNYRLLREATPSRSDWQLWCDALGLDESKALYGPAFEDDFLIVKAAVEGQGLALLSDVYVSSELQNKKLVKACQTAWPTHFAYYAVALPAVYERPAIRAFIRWLKSVASDALSNTSNATENVSSNT